MLHGPVYATAVELVRPYTRGPALALRAAKLDPDKVRERRSWTKADVVRGLKSAKKSGRHLSDSSVRREEPALYGAAVRMFGSFTAARTAAGIKSPRRR